MTGRERVLTGLMLAVILVIGGGFMLYQFIWSPIQEKEVLARKTEQEIEERKSKRLVMQSDIMRFETKTKRESLPADVYSARNDYERMLAGMLRAAEYPPSRTRIGHKEPDNKTSPTLAPKKPAYTKLAYDVETVGDLSSLVAFLYDFYRQPLLHRITRLSVQRMSTAKKDELDVKFAVEAIVIVGAETRPTLLAISPLIQGIGGGMTASAYVVRSVETGQGSPLDAAALLARAVGRNGETEYRRILGKNIFLGPPPEKPKREVVVEPPPPEKPKEMDYSPFVKLDTITFSDGKATAILTDSINGAVFDIEQMSSGSVYVRRSTWVIRKEGELVQKRKLKDYDYDKEYLSVGAEDTGNLRKYRVLRVQPSELILAEPDIEREKRMASVVPMALGGWAIPGLPPKRVYRWHIGTVLSSAIAKEVTPLTTAETREELYRPIELAPVADPGR